MTRRAAPALSLALLLAGGAAAGPLTFPGRNGRIAFVSERGGSPALDVVRPDGTHHSRLYRRGQVSQPSWSRDGKKIAFAEIRESTQGITVVGTRARTRKLTSHSPALWDSSPRWSPDGHWVVFERQNNEANAIDTFVVRADGRGLRRIARAAGNPSWSPDGHRIAVVVGPAGTKQIAVMGRHGSGQRTLTRGSGSAFDPDWSPDGKRIAFVAQRGGNYDIYVIGSNGRGERRLTTDLGQDLGPSWSPDGKQIAFASTRGTNQFDLYVMRADGSHQRRLTNTPWNEGDPTWQALRG